MSAKYSFVKAEGYGCRLAARLCDQYFGAAPTATLDGPTVLSFTPIRQLNLLVVRQLLHHWHTEVGRLRSPYFDFEAPAVQATLTQFQNTLSHHIRLTRSVFEPLLAQAAANTLRLALDPASVFAHIFFHQQPAPTLAQLRDGLRYLDVNKDFFTAFLNSLPTDQLLSPDSLLAQLRIYQAVHYRSQQPVEGLLAALSPLLPLMEADLREDEPTPSIPTSSSIPSSLANTSVVDVPVDITASSIIPVATSAEKTTSPFAPKPALSDVPVKLPLHEKLKATQPASASLTATLRAATSLPQSAPLTDRSAPKVETLREAISINQRFSFINELFNSENMEYHAAIQHLDSLSDQEQARLYITQTLSQRYDWSQKEEHLAKLLKLVERKYAPA